MRAGSCLLYTSINGILIKSAEALETAHDVRTVVLDKTGTVTEGAPSVTDVLAAPGVGKERLLELAVSVEGRSEHPLARAVCAYARERKVYPLLVEDFRQIPGEGVAALVDDRPSLAGNLRMMEARGIETGTFAEAARRLADEGKTPLFFAQDGELLGIVAVADTVKPSSAAALAVLKEMCIRDSLSAAPSSTASTTARSSKPCSPPTTSRRSPWRAWRCRAAEAWNMRRAPRDVYKRQVHRGLLAIGWLPVYAET